MTNKKIHLIGIGGINMSAIALLLKSKNNIVTGSDTQNSNIIENLKNKGIEITIGHNPDMVNDADIVIYTKAISDNDPELIRAKELNKEIYDRSEFIGLLSNNYENVICIAGTHGKSTTTGMTSLMFLENGLNPTIMVGAYLKDIDGTLHIGDSKYLILETCEYKDSFLHFKPTSAIILNIDDDHLDYFKNIDNIKASFQKFINLLPQDGTLTINNDDLNSKDLTSKVKTITYGIKNNADLVAKNITYDEIGHPLFDVYYNDEFLTNIHLNILGIHNVYNALAALSLAIEHNLDINLAKKGIEKYTGVKRRFEYIGKYNGAYIFDDYAHHPTEIKSTLDSAKNVKCNQNYVVFQSHTYSRTKEHLNEFADILSRFNNIIIAPIYPAREKNIYNIHESDLVDLIKDKNKNVLYIDSFDKIVNYLKNNVKENDLVITVGAGQINEVANKLCNI